MSDPTPQTPVEGTPAPKRADRIITWALIVLAVYSVFTGLADYMNPRVTMNDIYQGLNSTLPGLDLGTYTNIQFATIIGWVCVTVEAIVLGLTVYFSVKRMRAGKLSWWVPVAGAVISATAVSILLGVALATDAGFIESLQVFWANRK